MKKTYMQPTVSVLALDSLDVIATSPLEITYGEKGGIGDVIPY